MGGKGGAIELSVAVPCRESQPNITFPLMHSPSLGTRLPTEQHISRAHSIEQPHPKAYL